jgi:hypothetical protein
MEQPTSMEISAQERNVIAKRLKLWKQFTPDRPLSEGHFRKRSPFGCRKTRCFLCHGEKLTSKPRPQQKRQLEQAAWDLQEQL